MIDRTLEQTPIEVKIEGHVMKVNEIHDKQFESSSCGPHYGYHIFGTAFSNKTKDPN